MRVHYQQDNTRDMAAFTMFLQSRANGENSQRSSDSPNAELMRKFAMFLEMEKMMSDGMCGKHKHSHWQKHDTFGKHGFFGKHGHHGKHGRHGKHWRHGHHHGLHGHHGHGHGPWCRKPFWFMWTMYNEAPQTANNEEVIQNVIESGRNPSPPPKEGTSSDQRNEKCDRCQWKNRHWGHCSRRRLISTPQTSCNATASKSTENQAENAENNEETQNLEAMVENINIVSPPPAEIVNE